MNGELRARALTLALLACVAQPTWARSADPLASWNGGASKQAIQSFVAAVTRKGGADYVASAERIAVFDNDGTLWSEQPSARTPGVEGQRRLQGPGVPR
jgi:hypothetical protein